MYVFLCYLLYFVYYINKYGFIILKYYVFDLLLCKLFCNYALIYINCRSVSYTHLRAHETDSYLVCRLNHFLLIKTIRDKLQTNR